MRIISLTVVCLGLMLVVCPMIEVARVRQYGSIVKQVQVTSRTYERLVTDLRQYHRDVLMPPSLTTVVSQLDAVSGLERGWRAVSAAGVAVVLTGLAGLLIEKLKKVQPTRR